jgi:hypothetical protein
MEKIKARDGSAAAMAAKLQQKKEASIKKTGGAGQVTPKEANMEVGAGISGNLSSYGGSNISYQGKKKDGISN